MAVAVRCAECGKTLKVNSDALGKKIRCPACQSLFVAQQDDEDPTSEVPRRRPAPRGQPPRQGAGKPRSKGIKSAGGGPPWGLIAGGTAVAALAVVGILFAAGVFSRRPAAPDSAPVVAGPSAVTADSSATKAPERPLPPQIPIVQEPRASLSGHEGRVACLAITSDGKTLISLAWDSTIRVWDVDPPAVRLIIKTGLSSAYRMALAEGEKTLIVPGPKGILRWSLETGEALPGWDEIRGDAYGLAVNQGGRVVAIGTREQVKSEKPMQIPGIGETRNVQAYESHERYVLCDASTGAVSARLKGERTPSNGLAFVGDGQRLASVNGNDLVLWDLATGQPGPPIPAHQGVHWLAGSADGTMLATGGADKAVKLWDASGKLLATLTGLATSVGRVTFSQDGHCLAAATGDLLGDDRRSRNDEVRVWSVNTKEVSAAFKGPRGSMTSVALSGDGKTMVSGGQDGVIRFWDVPEPGSAAAPERTNSSQAEMAEALIKRHQGRVKRENGEIVQINLSKAKISDDDLDALRGLKSLRTLRMNQTPITDAGIARLQALPLLTLSVVQTGVGPEGAAAFKKAVPGCDIDWSEDDLNNAMTNANDDLATALQNVGADVRLEEGQISLINLGRSSRRLTDDGLKHLKELTNLKQLHLYGQPGNQREITDAGLAILESLPMLENLNVSHTKVTDAAIARLPTQFPNLKVVSITGTAVTDAAVASLSLLENLEYVALSASRMTPAGAAALRAKFPKASIIEK